MYHKDFYFYLLVLAGILMGVAGTKLYSFFSNENRAEWKREQCGKVSKGMGVTQVNAIMKQPEGLFRTDYEGKGTRYVFYYHSTWLESSPTFVRFQVSGDSLAVAECNCYDD